MKQALNTMATTKSDRHIMMPEVDLRADYEHPATYPAVYCYPTGRRIAGLRGIRVSIDHDATGTATTGTGDTIVRVI
jgi:hypothetical protein